MNRRLPLVAVALLVLAACGGDDSARVVDSADAPTTPSSAPDTTDTTDPDTTDPTGTNTEIGWDDCGVENVDCGYLSVPLDYSDPDGGQIDLFVARHNALDPENRIGRPRQIYTGAANRDFVDIGAR